MVPEDGEVHEKLVFMIFRRLPELRRTLGCLFPSVEKMEEATDKDGNISFKSLKGLKADVRVNHYIAAPGRRMSDGVIVESVGPAGSLIGTDDKKVKVLPPIRPVFDNIKLD